MRVFHIIPAAFDYFNDINDLAFKMVDNLSKSGVPVDAMAIRYGNTRKSTTARIKTIAPSREYLGDYNLNDAIKKLGDYDIVHLHYPTFGASGKILQELSTHPNLPLVITYYHPILWKDWFSVVLKLYDLYFASFLFKRAQAVTYFNEKNWNRSRVKGLVKSNVFLGDLSEPVKGYSAEESAVSHLLWLYQQLLDVPRA